MISKNSENKVRVNRIGGVREEREIYGKVPELEHSLFYHSTDWCPVESEGDKPGSKRQRLVPHPGDWRPGCPIYP